MAVLEKVSREEALYPTLLKQGPQSTSHFDMPCHTIFLIIRGVDSLQVEAGD